MKLKKYLAITAVFATMAGGAHPALAGNAGASMSACIKHVVETCNANSKRPHLCVKGGLKGCEQLHGGKPKPTNSGTMGRLKAAGQDAAPRFERRRN